MSGVNATDASIMFTFGWQGPNRYGKGWADNGLDTTLVNLVFENAKTKISVRIPENISPAVPQQLSFTCRRFNGKFCESESNPDILKVAIEKIRGLKILAAIDELSPHTGPRIMDSQGRITAERRILRSERQVPLQLPEDLEAGQTYNLVVTSNDYSFSAALVKKEPVQQSVPVQPSANDDQLVQDQTELFTLLGGPLLPLMGLKVMEFGMRCSQFPQLQPMQAASTAGVDAIKNEIQKIEANALKESMGKIRSLKSEWESTPLSQRAPKEKALYKACFQLIGPEGIADIMRSNLEGIMQNNISSDVEIIINQISGRFKEIVLKQVN